MRYRTFQTHLAKKEEMKMLYFILVVSIIGLIIDLGKAERFHLGHGLEILVIVCVMIYLIRNRAKKQVTQENSEESDDDIDIAADLESPPAPPPPAIYSVDQLIKDPHSFTNRYLTVTDGLVIYVKDLVDYVAALVVPLTSPSEEEPGSEARSSEIPKESLTRRDVVLLYLGEHENICYGDQLIEARGRWRCEELGSREIFFLDVSSHQVERAGQKEFKDLIKDFCCSLEIDYPE